MRRHVEPLLRPRHPHRHAQGWLVPKQPVFILKTVTIRVAEDVNAAIVPKRSQPAVWAESQVVDVGELDRQFTHREAGSQDPDVGLGRTAQSQEESGANQQRLEKPQSHDLILSWHCGLSQRLIRFSASYLTMAD